MKILMINSSRKSGNTASLLHLIAQFYRKSGHDVELLHLWDWDVGQCKGCERCIIKENCIISDHQKALELKLIGADALVLSSPVYMGQVTGRMKSFIDRTCRWFHRPELVGKPCLVVSTTAGSGLKKTVKYLEDTAVSWGMSPIGHITKKVIDLPYELNTKEIDILMGVTTWRKENYRPSLNTLMQYQVQKVLALKILPNDKAYWESKGWQNRVFYYPCRIPITKRILAGSFYKILANKIHPVE